MCTVTFVPKRAGYYLAMNRDEQVSRPAGLPPRTRVFDGKRRAFWPSEPSGGTWISVNDRGVSFALINWYSIDHRVRQAKRSRGEVIPTVQSADDFQSVGNLLESCSLERINPFRLIAVFLKTRAVVEWRWNLRRLTRRKYGWLNRQWASSGFDERKAQVIRRRTHQSRLGSKSAGDLRWLRRLHESHIPVLGPFSICMHRKDATTVSSTIISVSHSGAGMWYQAGNPCECGKRFRYYLPVRLQI